MKHRQVIKKKSTTCTSTGYTNLMVLRKCTVKCRKAIKKLWKFSTFIIWIVQGRNQLFDSLFAFLLEKVKKVQKKFFWQWRPERKPFGWTCLRIRDWHGSRSRRRPAGQNSGLWRSAAWWEVLVGCSPGRSIRDRVIVTRRVLSSLIKATFQRVIFPLTTRPFSHLPPPVHVITFSACKSPKHGEHKSRCDLLFI